MSEVLLHDPTDRKLWDEDTRTLISTWWLSAALAMVFLGMAVWYLNQFVPWQHQRMIEHDAFLANSTTMQAQITSCRPFMLDQVWVRYEFVLPNQPAIHGFSAVKGSCADHPAGTPLPIRYLPATPTESEAVNRRNLETFYFYASLFTLVGFLINILNFGWRSVHAALLAIKGRVRIGRIISVKRNLFRVRVVRYTVTADDGTVQKGKRVIRIDNITPELVAGAPIPVLYANKHIHWPFGLVIRG